MDALALLDCLPTPPAMGTTTIVQASTRTSTTTMQITTNGKRFSAIICCICDYGNIGMLHADGERSVYELKRAMLYLARYANIPALLSIFWSRIKENPNNPVWENKRHFVMEKGNIEYVMMYLGGKGNKKGEWIKKQNGIEEAQRAMRCVLRDWEKFDSCRRQRVIRQQQASEKRHEERRQARLLQARKEQAKKMKKEHMSTKKLKRTRKANRKTSAKQTEQVEKAKEEKEAEQCSEFDKWAAEFLKGEPEVEEVKAEETDEEMKMVEWEDVPIN